MPENSMLSLVTILLAMVLILVLAYYVSRALGRGRNRRAAGKYLNVIDQMAIGQDRALLIVSVGDEHYLVGSASGSVTLLAKLDGEFPEETPPKETKSFRDFHALMEKYNRKNE